MYQGRDYFKPGPDDSDSVRADRGAQSLAGLSKRGWDCGEGVMGGSRQGVVFTNNNQWSIRERRNRPRTAFRATSMLMEDGRNECLIVEARVASNGLEKRQRNNVSSQNGPE
jgi:hypothetical protein